MTLWKNCLQTKQRIVYDTLSRPFANNTFVLISLIFGWVTAPIDSLEEYIHTSPTNLCASKWTWWNSHFNPLKIKAKTAKSFAKSFAKPYQKHKIGRIFMQIYKKNEHLYIVFCINTRFCQNDIKKMPGDFWRIDSNLCIPRLFESLSTRSFFPLFTIYQY